MATDPINHHKTYDLLRRAISAALNDAHTARTAAEVERYFVVRIPMGEDGGRSVNDLAWVCDQYGTIDGPYTVANAKAVAWDENNPKLAAAYRAEIV
jgi:hypothetical protein